MGGKAINKIRNIRGSWEENLDNEINFKDTK